MSAVMTGRRYKSFAEILARVGGVPAERILPYPAPGTATPEDAFDPKYVGDSGVELVGGVLVEKTVGVYDEYIAGRLFHLIQVFMDEHNLGAVTGSQGGYWFASDTMRMPDVSVVLWESLDDPDEIEERGEAFLRTPPDLVVEVLSPGNTPREMDIKLGEYAKAGVKLVWYVDPDRKEVAVFPKARAKSKVTLGVDATLDGGTVLPGFTVPVAKLFEKRAPAGRKAARPPKKPKKG
jgi:Uma2 family endonuclease